MTLNERAHKTMKETPAGTASDLPAEADQSPVLTGKYLSKVYHSTKGIIQVDKPNKHSPLAMPRGYIYSVLGGHIRGLPWPSTDFSPVQL